MILAVRGSGIVMLINDSGCKGSGIVMLINDSGCKGVWYCHADK